MQDGNAIDYTPGSDVSSGDVVVVGTMVGIAPSDIASGALGAIQVSGVGEFPKASGSSTAIAAGALVYWDVANQVAQTDDESAANKLIGTTIAATVDADTAVKVLMHR